MIDWTRPLRAVGDHSYTILVNSTSGDVVIGALVDKNGKKLGLLTWDRTTGVPMAGGRGFPYSAWRAENVPVDPAEADSVERIRMFYNAGGSRFSRTDAQALLQAIDDRDEVLEEHKRLVREIDVALNGEKRAAPQASLVDILAQVKNPVRDIIKVRARPECPFTHCDKPLDCKDGCVNPSC